MNTAHRRLSLSWAALVAALALFVAGPLSLSAQQALTTLEYRVVGQQLGVSPAAVAVPKGIAGSVLTTVAGELPPGAFVEATLRGPSFPARRLVAAPNQPLLLPPLNLVGDYSLDGIRLVDPATGATILEGLPGSVPVRVFDEVLISRVTSRPLTLDEIQERGIQIDESNFRAVEFEVGFVIDGQTIPVRFPVVAPAFRQSTEIIPAAELEERLVEVARINNELARGVVLPPALEVAGLNIEMTGINFQFVDEVEQDLALRIPPIPALMVIPGNIGFLNQFFSVMIFTENGAPAGSGLSVRDVEAEIVLPVGPDRVRGTWDNPGDDPLRMARVGPEGVIEQVKSIVRPGPDGILGTSDDIPRLNPGQTGQAEFLVEGLQEGLHVLDLNLTGTLDGLAAGPVRISGRAAGSVLVRNPRFSMAFTHPRTVRAGEPYEASVTILNTSNVPANLVSVSLNENNISGGLLETEGTVELGTILPGETATATYRIRSQRTGSITFSNLTTSDDSLVGRFRLRTGVDERGVTLSPDTLLLPDFVDELPPALVMAAQRVLGQALSAATAGQVPPGVRRVPRAFILQKAIELAEAGQRIRYGEGADRVLPDLLLDWQGGRASHDGWDQILRTTDAGREWREAIMLAMDAASGGSDAVSSFAASVEDLAGRGEVWYAAAIEGPGGTLSATTFTLNAAGDRRVTLNRSDLPLGLGYRGVEGAWMVSREAGEFRWRFDAAVAESFSVGVWQIDGAGVAQERIWTIPGVPAGSCLSFDAAGEGSPQLQLSLSCGSTVDNVFPADPVIRNERPPAVIAVRQDPEVLVGRPPKPCSSPSTTSRLGETVRVSNYGNVIAVLFSKPMTQATANVPEAYTFDNGNEAAFVQVQPGGRVALLTMRQPVGGLIPRDLSVAASVTDVRGNPIITAPIPLDSRLVEGISIRGRVVRADGSIAVGVPVTLTYNDEVETFDGCEEWIRRISQVMSREDGTFDFDFVLSGIRYTISVTDTSGLSGDAIALILESTRDDQINRQRLEELAASPAVANTLLAQFAAGSLPAAIAKAEGIDRALVRDFVSAGSARQGTEAVFSLRFRGRGTVIGQVLESDGVTPVAGASVNLFPAPESRELGRGLFSDETGRFAFYGVPLGTLSLEVTSPAGRTRLIAESLNAPGEILPVEVILSESVTVFTSLRGRVTEADGTPHAGGQVYIGRFDPAGRYCCIVAVATADSEGYWVADTVPVGTYDPLALSSDGRRRGDRRSIVAVAGAINTANITLQARAVVTGRVETSTGLPVANALVGGGEVLAQTDALGRFTLTGVPTGRRTIETGLERNPDAGIDFPRFGSASLEVIGGQENFVVVRLTPAGRIIGRILDITGQPVPRARVAIPQQGGFLWVQADRFGNYEFVGLGLDRYDLSSPAPPTEDPFDAGAAISAITSGSQDDMLAAIGEAFAAFTGINNPLLNGDGSNFNPLSWGFVSNVQLQFDGQTVIADIRHLGEGTISGTVLNGQGVPIGARVRLTGVGPSLTGKPIMMIRGERDSDPALGTFEFPGQALVGDWGLQAASPFFPVVISQSGRTTSLEPNATGRVLQFPPVFETNGSLAGQVLTPDGSPAGEDIDVQISFGPDFVIRTAANGRFATQAGTFTLPAGGYTVTATDPATGATGRTSTSVKGGQVNETSVRLLGRGVASILVRRADGTPAANATVELKGGAYPFDLFEGFTDATGRVVFSNLFEGPYAISADLVVGATRLSGRTGVNVPRGGMGQATLTFGGTATVHGRFVSTDGVTPISFANISLGSLAFSTTDGEGRFAFADVPLGSYRLVGADAVTGRSGALVVALSMVNEIREVTLRETALGEIVGYVVDGYGTGFVPNASVTLRHSDPFVAVRTATTGPEGDFRFPGTPVGGFTLEAKDPLTGFSGLISAELPTGTALLSRNVPLQPLANLTVQVVEPDGTTPASLAQVRLLLGVNSVVTDTDGNGVARFEGIPISGQARSIIAESIEPGRTHRWAGARALINTQGREESIELNLRGVGQVNGQVFLGSGTPAPGAEVRLIIGNESIAVAGGILPKPSAGRVETVIADGDGRFTFPNVPQGDFRLTAVFLALAGTVNSTLSFDGVTVNEEIVLSNSGKVVGRILRADGFSLAPETDVLLTYPSLSGLPGRANAVTDANGLFAIANVPVGQVSSEFINTSVGGLALRTFPISVNNEIFDLGDIILDEDFPEVIAIDPEDSADDVDIFTTVDFFFSEPLDPASLFASGVFIRPIGGGVVVPASLELLDAPDGPFNSLLRLTPDAALESEVTYEAIVVDGNLLNALGSITNRGPRDLVGRPLPALFRATFTTRDQRPPVLLSFTPADASEQVDPRGVIRLSFDEPIRPDAVITVTGPSGSIAGNVSLGVNGLVLTFVPSVELPVNATFSVSVDNVADLAGNFAEDQPLTASFATLDTLGPEIAQLRIKDDAPAVAGSTITLEAVLAELEVDARVRFTVNFTPLGTTAAGVFEIPYTLPTSGTVTIRAIAIDRFGNEGPVAELPVSIITNQPPTITFTRINPPTGAVGTGGTFSVRVEATDDGGVAELRAAASGAAVVPLRVTTGEPIFIQGSVSSSAGPDASINILAISTDNSGTSSGEQTFSIPLFDNTPPTVAFSEPVAGTAFVAGAVVPLILSVGDNFGVARVEVSVSGAFSFSEVLEPEPVPGTQSLVVEIPIPESTPNDGAAFTVTARTFDAVGLSSGLVTRVMGMRDLVPPLLLSVTPPDESDNQPVFSGGWTLTFSRALDATTVTQDRLTVVDVIGDPIPFTLSLPSGESVNIRPTDLPLEVETTYTLTVLPGFTDLAGNDWVDTEGNVVPVEGLSFSFTTGSATSIEPFAGDPIVPGQTITARLLLAPESVITAATFAFNDGSPISRSVPAGSTVVEQRLTLPTDATEAILRVTATIAEENVEFAPVVLTVRPRGVDDSGDGLTNGWKADNGLDPFVHDADDPVLFTDHFEDGGYTAEFWYDPDNRWMLSDNRYRRMFASNPTNISTIPTTAGLTDFDLILDINNAHDGGILLRSDARGNNGLFFIFTPENGVAYFKLRSNGIFAAAQLGQVAISNTLRGQGFRLHLSARGNTFSVTGALLHTPDVEIFSTTLAERSETAALRGGYVGLYSYGGTAQSPVSYVEHFDRIEIRLPDALGIPIGRDADGLTHLDQFELATDPRTLDSDNDGLADGAEVWGKYQALGWWRGEATTTDVFRIHSGVIQNGSVGYAEGVRGRAFAFDGGSGRIQMLNSGTGSLQLNGEALTIEAWVNQADRTQTGNGDDAQVIFDKYFDGAPNGYLLYLVNGRPSLFVATGDHTEGISVVASDALPLNAWVHLAGVYDGTALRLYVDGSEITTTAATGALLPNNLAAAIGNDNGGSTGFGFKGRIDEVAVYGHALPAAHIAELASLVRDGRAFVLDPQDADSDGDGIPDGIDPFPLLPNRAPTVGASSFTVNSGLPRTFTEAAILDGASDPDGDSILLTGAFTQPENGEVSFDADERTFTYTSTFGFSGSDSFTYTLGDEWGLTATGTIEITVSANRPPIIENNTDSYALRFSGGDGRVILPNGAIHASTQVSLEMWFKADPGSAGGVLFFYSDRPFPQLQSSYVPVIYIDTSGRLRGNFWTSVNQMISPADVRDGEWHQVVLIGAGSSQSLWLDGVRIGESNSAVNHLSMIHNIIGLGYTVNWPSGNANWYPFVGEIDLVRIWHRALNASEFPQAYTAPLLVSNDNLHLAYKLGLQSSTGQIDDLSGNGRTGIIAGSAGQAPELVIAVNPATGNWPVIQIPADRSTAFVLPGEDPDNDPLTARILDLPSNGRLFQYDNGVAGEEIFDVPTVVTDSRRRIVYIPESSFIGFDRIGYEVNDGLETSLPAFLSLRVRPFDEPLTNDLWDLSRGSTVTAHSGVRPDSLPGNMFGGSGGIEPANTLFAEDRPAGFTHFIEWQTADIIWLEGFNLFANNDSNTVGNRGITEMRLFGRLSAEDEFALLATHTVPANPYFPDGFLRVQAHLAQSFTGRQFRAEFDQFGEGASFGPRIEELDAIGWRAAVIPLLAQLPLQNATATASQGSFPVSQTIDGNLASGGWAIDTGVLVPQTAVWETAFDVPLTPENELVFTLPQVFGSSHTLGRFRLSATSDSRATFADGLANGGDVTADWVVLEIVSVSGTGGETFEILEDQSILVGGPNPATTTTTVRARGFSGALSGLRLEALQHPSIPGNGGPGRTGHGNFVLTEFIAEAPALTTINRYPVAGDLLFPATAGEPLFLSAADLLAGAYDPDGDPIEPAFGSFGSPATGSLVIAGDGSGVTYTAPVGFGELDSFTYVVRDSNGLASTGTVVINVDFNRAPVARSLFDGYALRFNGAGGEVSLGNPEALRITGGQTLEMWLKPANFSQRRNPWAKAYAGEGTITQETDGTLNYFYGIAGNNSGSNGVQYQAFNTRQALSLDDWTHVALVRDLAGGVLRWYLNGRLVNQAAALFPAAAAGDLEAFIGRGYVSHYAGEIDEVRVWNVARTEAAIAADFRRKLTGGETGLAGYWRMDEGDGTSIGDATANGLAGTRGGGANAPEFVPSFVPFDTIPVAADGDPAALVLDGDDADGDELAAFVSRWPRRGGLFTTTDGLTPESSLAGAGDALLFEHTRQAVALPHAVLDESAANTVEFWMRTGRAANQALLSGANPANDNAYLLWFPNATTVQFYTGAGSTSFVQWTVAPVSDDAWRHFAFVRDPDAGGVELFINGESQGFREAVLPVLSIAPGGLYLAQEQDSVGGGWDANQNFRGLLDELRVWDHARPAAAIAADWNRVLTGNEDGLRAYYPMDTDAAALLDRSGNAFHGLLTSIGGPLDGSRPTVTVSSAPTHGGLPLEVPDAEGRLFYIPETRHYGLDTIGYRLSDGRLFSDAVVHPIFTERSPPGPVAVDAGAIAQGGTFTLINPFFNDFHPRGLPFETEEFTEPEHGTLDFADGQFVYTPDPGFAGEDAFTYRLTDGFSVSDAATVFVSVTQPEEIRWTNPAGGSFHTASNWSANRVPTPDEVAIIDLAGAYTVTVSADATVGQLRVGGPESALTLRQTGGTLTVSATSVVRAGSDYQLAGGTLRGLGTFIIEGVLTWTGGDMNDAGKTLIAAGATGTVSGNTNKGLNANRILENAGELLVTTPNLYFNLSGAGPNAIINNLAGGTLEARGNVNFTHNFASPDSAVNNAGLFRKTGGGVTRFSGNAIAFNNTGMVEVEDGTLRLEASAMLGGTIHIDAAGSVLLVGSQFTPAAGAVFEGAGALILQSGNLQAAHALALPHFTQTGGTVSGTGTITVTESFSWTGGDMNDAGKTLIAAGATGTVSGNTNKGLNANRILENAGELLVTTPNLYFNLSGAGPNAVINNLAGGTLEARGNVNFTHNFASPGSAVNNAGLFRKTGGGTTIFSSSAISFNNTGTLEVSEGTLRMDGGGSLGGDIVVGTGATLQLNGGGVTLSSGQQFVGEGTLLVSGANAGVPETLAFEGALNLSGGTVTFAEEQVFSSFAQSGGILAGIGTITVTETFSWTGGTMRDAGRTVIAAGATATISGNANKGLDAGRVLENAGTVLMTAPNLYFNLNNFGGGGRIDILAGGVFEAQGNTAFRHNFGSPGSAVNNAGLFRKTGGGTTFFSSSAIAFNNAGTLEVDEGTLRMDAGGTLGGDIVVGTGGTLQLNGGGVTLSSGQLFVGEGTLLVSGSTVGVPETFAFEGALNLSSGTVTFAEDQVLRSFALSGGILAGTGTLTVTEAFTWTGGTMRDGGRTVIPAGATATISGSASKGLDAGRVLENAGTVLMTAPNLYFNLNNFGGGGRIENLAGGVFESQGSTAFRQNFASPGSAVNNAGLFRKTGGGTALFTTNAIALNNTGTIELVDGSLHPQAGFTQAGTVRGNGTVVAGFTNSGILAPARTPGGLTVQGNLAFAGDARLEIGIGEDAEGGGSAHGRLTVTGTATLAGTLALAWDNGFVPDEGAGFAVLSANGRVNEFTTLEGTEGLGGFVAFVDYTATGVEVVTTPALSGDSFTFGSTNGPGLALEADPDGGWSVLVAYPELMVPAIEGGRSRIEVSHDLLTWRPAPVVATADQTAPRTMSSHRVVRYRIDPVAFDAPAVFLRLVDAPAVEPASQDEGE